MRAGVVAELAGLAGASHALAEAAGDPMASVRAAAARALRRRPEPDARAALDRLAHDEWPLVREAVERP